MRAAPAEEATGFEAPPSSTIIADVIEASSTSTPAGISYETPAESFSALPNAPA